MVSDSSVPALEMMSQHDGLCPLLSELVIPDLSILVSELLEPTAYQIHHCHPHYLMSSAPEIVGGWMDWWMRVQHLWLHLLLIVKRKHSSVFVYRGVDDCIRNHNHCSTSFSRPGLEFQLSLQPHILTGDNVHKVLSILHKH